MENMNPPGQQPTPAPAAESAKPKMWVVAVVLLAAVAAVLYFVFGSASPKAIPEPSAVPSAAESQNPGAADADAVAQDLADAVPTDADADLNAIDQELAQ
jgi:hypothetical protein